MKQLKGALYYYGVNMRFSLMIFWGILLGILLLNLVIELIVGESGVNLYFSFAIPIYLFAAIIGSWVVKNVIPYLVKMGVTRMTIYIATGITFILLALVNGAVSNTLQTLIIDVFGSSMEGAATLKMEGEVIADSGSLIGLFAEDTWWNRFVIDVSVQFIIVAVSFLVGLVFYRFKLIGGAALIGGLLIAFIYSITSGWLVDVVMDLLNDFSMIFFYQLFLIGLLIYLLTHILLRRLTL